MSPIYEKDNYFECHPVVCCQVLKNECRSDLFGLKSHFEELSELNTEIIPFMGTHGFKSEQWLIYC